MNNQLFSEQISDSIELFQGDCLDIMPVLHERGIQVDMILADPPYGSTHCRWDSIINFTALWKSINALCYDETPVLLFSQHPFTCVLGCSNIQNLRYNWIWEKTQGTGFLNAKKMPLKCHEDILVFYRKLPKYQPIKTTGHTRKVVMADHQKKCDQGDIYGIHDRFSDYDSTDRYPRSVLKYKSDKQTSHLHPTQKPVALLEYFIKTYTEEGDTVLDFVMGSGSCGVACKNTGRKFIGIEKEIEYYNLSKKRLSE
jgi:site-specific DNA-methyltransferase (adenine-specific)